MPTEEHNLECRVLLFAPTGKDAYLAARVLESGNVQSHICGSAHEVMAELMRGAGAVLAMEEAFTPSFLNAMAGYVDLQPPWSDVPVLVVTRQGADSPELLALMECLRNTTLLERPLRTRALISTVRTALNARRRQYQVREAEQRKDEFLASLAHELRNPLAPIRASMGLLALSHPASASVTRVRNVVERQIDHLTRLIDDLLDVARITSGKVVLQREPVSLSSVVAHAMEICTPLLKGAGHMVDIRQPSQDVMLDADPVRVVQSLANILGNAIKFTPGPGTISLHAEVQGREVLFRVKDCGVGLTPEALTRIFDMFAQSTAVQASSRGSGGLGIGLSLAKRFAEMHDGSITASSAGTGFGSEFVMTLPVVLDTDIKNAADFADPLGPDAAAANRKVLVVDDNRDAADMLQLLFEADGFTVTATYDGAQAVATAKQHPPDIVVMDIGMPGMNGYEAVRLIREQPGGKNILMIALTGWGQESAKQQAVEAGFDHHLVKPVNFEVLRALLRKA